MHSPKYKSKRRHCMTKDSTYIYLLSSLVTDVGNFGIQYNYQAIATAMLIMYESVCTTDTESCMNGEQAAWVSAWITASIFIGSILGQTTMGYLADHIDRHHAMRITLLLASIGAIGSAVAPTGTPTAIYCTIIVFRFILGIGIGGVYPLSATIAAEEAVAINRHMAQGGKVVDVVAAAKAFFWQLPGAFTPWLLGFIFTYTTLTIEVKWRLILGFGAIPTSLVFILNEIEKHAIDMYLVADISETGTASTTVSSISFKDDNSESEVKAQDNESSELVTDLENMTDTSPLYPTASTTSHTSPPLTTDRPRRAASPSLSTGDLTYRLLVSGGAWFCYDFIFYGFTLYAGVLLHHIVHSASSANISISCTESIRRIATIQMISFAITLPVLIAIIVLLKTHSTRIIQIMGFFIIATSLLIFSIMLFLHFEESSSSTALLVVYCLIMLSLHCGPEVTTFIIPVEMYPLEIRATFDGISAAMGKVGALVGVVAFGPIIVASSFAVVFTICTLFALLGTFLSFGVTEDYRYRDSRTVVFG